MNKRSKSTLCVLYCGGQIETRVGVVLRDRVQIIRSKLVALFLLHQRDNHNQSICCFTVFSSHEGSNRKSCSNQSHYYQTITIIITISFSTTTLEATLSITATISTTKWPSCTQHCRLLLLPVVLPDALLHHHPHHHNLLSTVSVTSYYSHQAWTVC